MGDIRKNLRSYKKQRLSYRSANLADAGVEMVRRLGGDDGNVNDDDADGHSIKSLEDLPRNVLENILSHMDNGNDKHIRSVSKYMREIYDDSLLRRFTSWYTAKNSPDPSELAVLKVIQIIKDCFMEFKVYQQIFADLFAECLSGAFNPNEDFRPYTFIKLLNQFCLLCHMHNWLNPMHPKNLMFTVALLTLLKNLTEQKNIKMEEVGENLYLHIKLECKYIKEIFITNVFDSLDVKHFHLIQMLSELLIFQLSGTHHNFLVHSIGSNSYKVCYNLAPNLRRKTLSNFWITITGSENVRRFCKHVLTSSVIDWTQACCLDEFDILVNCGRSLKDKNDFSPPSPAEYSLQKF